jgi:hypothetical protein
MAKEPKLVGRRKLPPEDKRWKKGISGNPRGRPTKQDSLTTLLCELSGTICPADPKQRTWEELLALNTLQLALKGNATALREVWERLAGKVPQAAELSIAPDGPVQIQVVYGDEEDKDQGGDKGKHENGDDAGSSETG